MATTSASPTQAPESGSSNSFSRLFGVLFSPKATFQSIVKRPSWWLPVVLLCLLSVVVVGIFDKRGGWPPYFQHQDQASSRFEQMPLKQQQQTLAAQVKYGPKVVYGEVVIAIPLVIVVVSAILLAMFNLVYGAQIKFKTALSITSYAWVPGIISGLLGIS